MAQQVLHRRALLNLEYLFTMPESGMVLLRACSLRYILWLEEHTLLSLLVPNAAHCLAHGWATVEELSSCDRSHRDAILSDSGVALMTGKLLSFSEMKELPLSVVELLTSNLELAGNLLREHLVSADELYAIPSDCLPCLFINNDCLHVMQHTGMRPLELLDQAREFQTSLVDPSCASGAAAVLAGPGFNQFLQVKRRELLKQSCDDGFGESDIDCDDDGSDGSGSIEDEQLDDEDDDDASD